MKQLKFYKGKPVGADRPSNFEPLMTVPGDGRIDQFRKIYAYSALKQSFPWATTFRAGMILIYKKENISEFLMVWQSPVEYNTAQGSYILPKRLGFPKGSACPADKSAFDTAAREVSEETGINVLTIPLRFASCVILFPRAQDNYQEIQIYFIGYLQDRPTLKTCDAEIVGHQWVDARSNLRVISPTTRATREILESLETVNI